MHSSPSTCALDQKDGAGITSISDSEGGGLERLPDLLLVEIAQFLPPNEVLVTLERLSRRFNAVLSSAPLTGTLRLSTPLASQIFFQLFCPSCQYRRWNRRHRRQTRKHSANVRSEGCEESSRQSRSASSGGGGLSRIKTKLEAFPPSCLPQITSSSSPHSRGVPSTSEPLSSLPYTRSSPPPSSSAHPPFCHQQRAISESGPNGSRPSTENITCKPLAASCLPQSEVDSGPSPSDSLKSFSHHTSIGPPQFPHSSRALHSPHGYTASPLPSSLAPPPFSELVQKFITSPSTSHTLEERTSPPKCNSQVRISSNGKITLQSASEEVVSSFRKDQAIWAEGVRPSVERGPHLVEVASAGNPADGNLHRGGLPSLSPASCPDVSAPPAPSHRRCRRLRGALLFSRLQSLSGLFLSLSHSEISRSHLRHLLGSVMPAGLQSLRIEVSSSQSLHWRSATGGVQTSPALSEGNGSEVADCATRRGSSVVGASGGSKGVLLSPQSPRLMVQAECISNCSPDEIVLSTQNGSLFQQKKKRKLSGNCDDDKTNGDAFLSSSPPNDTFSPSPIHSNATASLERKGRFPPVLSGGEKSATIGSNSVCEGRPLSDSQRVCGSGDSSSPSKRPSAPCAVCNEWEDICCDACGHLCACCRGVCGFGCCSSTSDTARASRQARQSTASERLGDEWQGASSYREKSPPTIISATPAPYLMNSELWLEEGDWRQLLCRLRELRVLDVMLSAKIGFLGRAVMRLVMPGDDEGDELASSFDALSSYRGGVASSSVEPWEMDQSDDSESDADVGDDSNTSSSTKGWTRSGDPSTPPPSAARSDPAQSSQAPPLSCSKQSTCLSHLGHSSARSPQPPSHFSDQSFPLSKLETLRLSNITQASLRIPRRACLPSLKELHLAFIEVNIRSHDIRGLFSCWASTDLVRPEVCHCPQRCPEICPLERLSLYTENSDDEQFSLALLLNRAIEGSTDLNAQQNNVLNNINALQNNAADNASNQRQPLNLPVPSHLPTRPFFPASPSTIARPPYILSPATVTPASLPSSSSQPVVSSDAPTLLDAIVTSRPSYGRTGRHHHQRLAEAAPVNSSSQSLSTSPARRSGEGAAPPERGGLARSQHPPFTVAAPPFQHQIRGVAPSQFVNEEPLSTPRASRAARSLWLPFLRILQVPRVGLLSPQLPNAAPHIEELLSFESSEFRSAAVCREISDRALWSSKYAVDSAASRSSDGSRMCPRLPGGSAASSSSNSYCAGIHYHPHDGRRCPFSHPNPPVSFPTPSQRFNSAPALQQLANQRILMDGDESTARRIARRSAERHNTDTQLFTNASPVSNSISGGCTSSVGSLDCSAAYESDALPAFSSRPTTTSGMKWGSPSSPRSPLPALPRSADGAGSYCQSQSCQQYPPYTFRLSTRAVSSTNSHRLLSTAIRGEMSAAGVDKESRTGLPLNLPPALSPGMSVETLESVDELLDFVDDDEDGTATDTSTKSSNMRRDSIFCPFPPYKVSQQSSIRASQSACDLRYFSSSSRHRSSDSTSSPLLTVSRRHPSADPAFSNAYRDALPASPAMLPVVREHRGEGSFTTGGRGADSAFARSRGGGGWIVTDRHRNLQWGSERGSSGSRLSCDLGISSGDGGEYSSLGGGDDEGIVIPSADRVIKHRCASIQSPHPINGLGSRGAQLRNAEAPTCDVQRSSSAVAAVINGESASSQQQGQQSTTRALLDPLNQSGDVSPRNTSSLSCSPQAKSLVVSLHHAIDDAADPPSSSKRNASFSMCCEHPLYAYVTLRRTPSVIRLQGLVRGLPLLRRVAFYRPLDPTQIVGLQEMLQPYAMRGMDFITGRTHQSFKTNRHGLLLPQGSDAAERSELSDNSKPEKVIVPMQPFVEAPQRNCATSMRGGGGNSSRQVGSDVSIEGGVTDNCGDGRLLIRDKRHEMTGGVPQWDVILVRRIPPICRTRATIRPPEWETHSSGAPCERVPSPSSNVFYTQNASCDDESGAALGDYEGRCECRYGASKESNDTFCDDALAHKCNGSPTSSSSPQFSGVPFSVIPQNDLWVSSKGNEHERCVGLSDCRRRIDQPHSQKGTPQRQQQQQQQQDLAPPQQGQQHLPQHQEELQQQHREQRPQSHQQQKQPSQQRRHESKLCHECCWAETKCLSHAAAAARDTRGTSEPSVRCLSAAAESSNCDQASGSPCGTSAQQQQQPPELLTASSPHNSGTQHRRNEVDAKGDYRSGLCREPSEASLLVTSTVTSWQQRDRSWADWDDKATDEQFEVIAGEDLPQFFVPPS